MTIPKIIHYVWVGGNPVPDHLKRNIESWKRTNPSFEIMLWNEQNIDLENRFIKTALKAKGWATASNLIRLMALYEYGGIYLDTDVEIFKSLDDLLPRNCFWGFQDQAPGRERVNNAIIGAAKGHWFIKDLIDRINSRFTGDEFPTYTAPALITTMLEEVGLGAYSEEVIRLKDIDIFPTRYFYPLPYGEAFSEKFITPDSYGVHYWEKSWHNERWVPKTRWGRLSKRLRSMFSSFPQTKSG